jgi:hypothetical protein
MGAAILSPFLDQDTIKWDRILILPLCFEHDLFGKPVSTFPDHAPVMIFSHIAVVCGQAQTAFSP